MVITARGRARLFGPGVALALIVGASACGDDSATKTAAEPTGACAQLVAFDAAASDAGDTSTTTGDAAKALGAQLAPLWAQALLAVPEAARAPGAVVTKAIADLGTGDATAFNADATLEGYTTVLAAGVKACGIAQRTVPATKTGEKYAFGNLPKRLDAGVLAVTVENKDAEPHVLVVLRKNDGDTRSVEELLALPEDQSASAGTPAGAAFAPPGATSVGLLRLTPGKYFYFCPIPIGGAEGAPPHFTNGMLGEFIVG